MRYLLIPVAMAAALPAAAQTRYSVYCANNKIEVDSRTPEQMRSARGSGACLLQSFNFATDARDFARRNFGGEGSRCSCR